ncbi:UBP-type zinc finger domain-containing protein [Pseudonocardia bannensis]|uniref:UBP-type zinc finger domain-containing protein n=1 Tax=Pseudonocardia bannensis TaxID=630973 RepID=A0A848DDK2_9PSEU|nr:UBP-type zinc finger domain-containing protein [Pseudonocardia bannensis]NMH90679.1 UBP-type zinc finger domain-containing protein [Pseudonocardia bannensis]
MSCVHTVACDAPDWTEPAPDSPSGCADCEALGARVWAHLRLCLTCGHVACCDSSPYRHATGHFRSTQHPVIRSYEPGPSWRWCYVDEQIV